MGTHLNASPLAEPPTFPSDHHDNSPLQQVSIDIYEPCKAATEFSLLHSSEAASESESKPRKSNFPSPEIACRVMIPNQTAPSARVPRAPTMSRISTFRAKPKSRFGEPSLPIDGHESSGPPMPMISENLTSSDQHNCGGAAADHGAPFARRTNYKLKAAAAAAAAISPPSSKEDGLIAKEGPDEKEVYQRVTAQLSARNHRRLRIRVLIQLSVFLFLLVSFICSLTVEGFKSHVLYGLRLWKWLLLLVVIFSGMLITHWIVHAVVFFIEWRYLLRKNVLYFTHGLKNSVEVFIWITVVLATWVMVIEPGESGRTRKILDFVTWTLVSALIGAFLWLVKTTLLKLLASSFHLNRFFDRIQESVFHHYVLQTLAGRPVVELAAQMNTSSNKSESGSSTQGGQVSFAENAKANKEKKVVDVGKLHQMKEEKVPAWTMQLLVDVVSNSGLSTMSGMLSEDVVEGGVELDDDEITSEEQAIATAVRIFDNIVQDKDEKSYIDGDDLQRFLISEEVDHLLPMFEMNEKGQISLKAFAKWVVKVYKDQVALRHALNDNKTAVKQLNKIVTAILIVMIIVIWLLLTEIATTKFIVFMSSQLVVAAFIFGNTCKTIFEAIIFVFVMHPFDVGDRCLIDGNTMVVEEMNILTTVFLKWDKEKVYYPNTSLAAKAIGNFFRSPDQGDALEFCIDFTTPLSKIGDLKDRIKIYLEQNPNFWHPQHNILVKEIENVDKIKMALTVNHTMNFQDYPEKNRRKSELVLEMKKIFEELDIKYHLLPQEISLRYGG